MSDAKPDSLGSLASGPLGESQPHPAGQPPQSSARSAFDEFVSPSKLVPHDLATTDDPDTLPGVADYDEGEDEAPVRFAGGSPTRHYEAAFESCLRTVGVPYIIADQGHRAVFAGLNVKCFDFLVAGAGGVSWIVDVKGRRVPLNSEGRTSGGLQTWVTQDDVDSLSRWEERFGRGHAALFVFAYWLSRRPEAESQPASLSTLGYHPVYDYEGGLYHFRGILLSDYKTALRVRSPRWKTVHIPAKFFWDYSRPFRELV